MAYNPKYLAKDYEYRAKHFKRVGIDFDKDYYAEILKPAADAAGLPVNSYIKQAISEKIERERS